MLNTLPLFYFPSTICWVDDDDLFLTAINSTFGTHYRCRTFNTPEKALQFFTSYTPAVAQIELIRPFTESDLFDTSQHLPVNLNIPAITRLSQMANNLLEISLLIIDYSMPRTNGLEICQRLKHLPFKKILLTGELTNETALTAFNQGLIDKFIKKDHGITETLKSTINALCDQYFCEQTNHLLIHMETIRKSPLSDPAFCEFFHTLRQKLNIKE
ncbi:MAG TPA: response regulator, partial [Gammaproteobacteria bacterium]|nr:response regulator [Gammaproteobacteria bacterium]